MNCRAALLILIPLLLHGAAEAAPKITELPDRIVVELRGTPTTPEPQPSPSPSREPYLVERFVEHPDHYEVELVGRPHGKEEPSRGEQTRRMVSFSPAVAESAPEPPPSPASPNGGGSPGLAQSPYYNDLSQRIRTLQQERQEFLRSGQDESPQEREMKRRLANEKLKEIRAVSEEMARLRSQGGS